MTPRSILKVGDKLELHVPASQVKSSSSNRTQVAKATQPASGTQEDKIVHVVAKGHNPTIIARRYGVRVSDLFKWNNWPRRHVLQIGDEVVVFKK